MSVFAEGLYGKTNNDVHETCVAQGSVHADEFPTNNQTVSMSIDI